VRRETGKEQVVQVAGTLKFGNGHCLVEFRHSTEYLMGLTIKRPDIKKWSVMESPTRNGGGLIRSRR
jgi:hypothetical protein